MNKCHLATVKLTLPNYEKREIKLTVTNEILYTTAKAQLIEETKQALFKNYSNECDLINIESNRVVFDKQWCDLMPELLYLLNQVLD